MMQVEKNINVTSIVLRTSITTENFGSILNNVAKSNGRAG